MPREMDREPLRLSGVWQPQTLVPVLEGEVAEEGLAEITPNRGGLDVGVTWRPPLGEETTASAGLDQTCPPPRPPHRSRVECGTVCEG